MLAENSKGELVIIEVQNNRELDYFHRMLYGTSKAITEYINQGDNRDKIMQILKELGYKTKRVGG
jgi:adenylate cyclase class IV